MTSTLVRDSQRARVYAAEHIVTAMLDRAHEAPTVEAYGSHLILPNERKFGNLQNIQIYVNAVLALNWVNKRWPREAARPVTVVAAHGNAHKASMFPSGKMEFPSAGKDRGRWSYREMVVLHELAHHLTSGDRHGPAFAAAFVDLVGELMSPEAGLLLRAAFDEGGVDLK